MIRQAAAIAIALCLNPSQLQAQTTTFKVSTASANVHQSPSTGSPVIGTAARGAVLEVTRELGSWVKVKWAIATDGVGYVHVSTGLIARGSSPTSSLAAAAQSPAPRPAPRPVSPQPPPPPPAPGAPVPPPPLAPGEYMFTPTHSFGVGGIVGGPSLGVGASARAWPRQRVGLQVEISREARSDAPALTSVQLAPSLLVAPPDRVTDSFWLRPYIGAGPTLQRETLDIVSDSRLGFQAFGGGEVTLPSMPRLALSADVRYRWLDTPFAGVERRRLGLSVSGHWYFK
jgi:hypothetical protein